MKTVYKLFDLGYGRKILAKEPTVMLSSIVWRANHCVYYAPGELYVNHGRPYLAFEDMDAAHKYMRECGNTCMVCLELKVEKVHRFRDLDDLPNWVKTVFSFPDGTIGVPKLQMPRREDINITFMVKNHTFVSGKEFTDGAAEIATKWEGL